MIDHAALDVARLEALDTLLGVLDLRPVGVGRFRAEGAPGPFPHTFGGQLVAQALVAAAATTEDRPPSALYAGFVRPGRPTEPVELDVRTVRDGTTTATREVTLGQAGRALLTMVASFQMDDGRPWLPPSADAGPAPEDLPHLQDWVTQAPESMRDRSLVWVDRPPPVEMRMVEPPVFLGGPQASGPRTHWMRLPRDVGSDPRRHAALLAHASDYLLLDMAFRSHPVPFRSGRLGGTSLDHAVWFHEPTRFDRWHRHTQETVALAGERGLVRGAIHDEDGRLVASTAQAVLVRLADG